MAEPSLPPDVQSKLDRLVKLEATLSTARHDIRGMLTPMLLLADRLTTHTDGKVVRYADMMISCIKQIDDTLTASGEDG